MKEKLRLVIMSHLSDIQCEVSDGKPDIRVVNNRINFIKSLIQKHTDLKGEIDVNAEWEAFTKTNKYKN